MFRPYPTLTIDALGVPTPWLRADAGTRPD
jgi:hypothetical protein